MTKKVESIRAVLHHPKHPFRQADNFPKKSMKHRYERRKIREYLQLATELIDA
jgi:hypothetical protein